MQENQFDAAAFTSGVPVLPAGQSGAQPVQQQSADQKMRDVNLSMAGYARDANGNVMPANLAPQVSGEATSGQQQQQQPSEPQQPSQSNDFVIPKQQVDDLRSLIGKTEGDISYADIKAHVEKVKAEIEASRELLNTSGVFVNETIKANRSLLQQEDKDLAHHVLKGIVPDDQLSAYIDKLILSDALEPLVKGHRERITGEITSEQARLKAEHEAQVAQRLQQNQPVDTTVLKQEFLDAAKDVKNVYGISLGKTDGEIAETLGKAATALTDGTFVKEMVSNKKALMEMYVLWSYRDKMKDIFVSMGQQQGKADLLLNELGNARPIQQGLPVPLVNEGFDPEKFNRRG